MHAVRLGGQTAGSAKYDLLTALGLIGLRGSATDQTTALRLIQLVTARYNWRRDEVSIGQEDLARLWAVSARTVKREMQRLAQADLLICIRGGVKGRVGRYRLNHASIAAQSEPYWLDVGTDFQERMAERFAKAEVKVVPLRPVPKAEPGWQAVLSALAAEDAQVFAAWFSRLELIDLSEGVLQVRAPSAFAARYIEAHLLSRLLAAVAPRLGRVSQVVLKHD